MEERATVRGKQSARSRANTPLLAATLRDLRFPVAATARPPRVVAGYEILGEIGQGGMGIVYKARQLALDRVVALKMLRGAGGGRDDLARFRSEAEAVARLTHPGIVQIYEVGECDGQPFFSLEYVAGGSLDAWLDGKPQQASDAARLVRSLALTIQYAHEQGIVHRDLKPANVLLASAGQASLLAPDAKDNPGCLPCELKITDFGLAKRLDAESTTMAGEVVGTPSYMAPEQAEGNQRAVGPATDIWALGAILYECLTGRPPFVGGSVFETIEQVRNHDPIAPRSLIPTVPRDLDLICLKCLQKAADRRYACAASLADDLGRFLDGRPVLARPIGPAERAVKWARRRPTAAALLFVSSLLVAMLAVGMPIYIVHQETLVRKMTLEFEQTHEANRVAELARTCERKIAQGRELLRSGKVSDAESAVVCFATAIDRVVDDDAARYPELKRLRGEAAALRPAASAELEKLRGAGAARHRARRFLDMRDEAFFQLHHDLVGSPDPARPRAALNACVRALDRFPDLDCLSAEEAARLRAARLEVLLLTAEATARLDAGSAQRLREALALLDRIDDPDGPRHAVRLRRARYLGLLGDLAAAQAERQRADAVPPTTSLDWFLRGQDRLLAGDASGALADLDLALNSEPDLFWARVLRVVALQQRNKLAEARVELGLCIRARPNFAWCYLLRAFLHLKADQFAAAAQDLSAAERLDLDEPGRYSLLLHRGLLAMGGKRWADAARDFQRAILASPRYCQAHANLAEALWQSGNRAGALASINQAVRLEPGRADLLRARCRLRRDTGDLAGALRDLDRAVGLEPGLAADLRERAMLLYLTGRYGDALSASERVLAATPADPGALRLRAESLLELGRPHEALAAFDDFLDKSKGDAETYRRRAKARGLIGDVAGVVADCTVALGMSNDPALLLTRGWAHLVRGSPRDAFRDFDDVLRKSPADAEALIGRGAARVEKSEAKPGLADLEAGLALKPKSPRVVYHAARAFARLASQSPRPARDHERRALDLLRQAVEATPAADRTRFLREQIRRDDAFRPLSRAGLDALEPLAR